MNFNLVEMYNGLLRFNKHILNELAEGLKHLPNLDGVSTGDSLIINEQGNPAWGSTAFIPTFENAAYGIEVADDNARKNKNKKYGINKHDKNRQYENEYLVDKLFNLKYKTSKYSLYKIYEPKERIIYRLPYYPDRIAHHAIMNVVKYIWTKSFIHEW